MRESSFQKCSPIPPKVFLIIKGTYSTTDRKVLQHRTGEETQGGGGGLMWAGLSVGGISGPWGPAGPVDQLGP